MSRPALGGGSCNWEARSDASAAEAAGEKVLQEIRRYGETTAATLETSLSVEEADRMLSELTVRDHLEVSLEHGRLGYALMGERRALL